MNKIIFVLLSCFLLSGCNREFWRSYLKECAQKENTNRQIIEPIQKQNIQIYEEKPVYEEKPEQTCPYCKGTGLRDHCLFCHGTGWEKWGCGDFTEYNKCYSCKGSGFLKCEYCNGKGWVK